MYHQITDLLTPGEADKLKNIGKYNASISDFSNELLQKVAKRYQSMVDDQEFILSSPSYWRIETVQRDTNGTMMVVN